MKTGERIATAGALLFAAAWWYLGSDYARGLLIGILTWTIVGQSWSFLADQGGMWSLGHNAFLGIGSYVMAYCTLSGFPFWLGLFFAVAAGALAGCIVGILTARLQSHYLSLVTFMFAVGMEVVANYLYGSYGIVISTEAANRTLDTPARGLVLMALFAVVTALLPVIRESAFGLKLRAVRDDPRAAASVGISIAGTRILAFTVSGALAAAAAPVFTLHYKVIGPETAFGIATSLNPIIYSILGGVGHLLGAFLGAVVLVPLSSEMSGVGLTLPGLNGLIYNGLLLVAIVFIPAGIAGLIRRRGVGVGSGPTRHG